LDTTLTETGEVAVSADIALGTLPVEDIVETLTTVLAVELKTAIDSRLD